MITDVTKSFDFLDSLDVNIAVIIQSRSLGEWDPTEDIKVTSGPEGSFTFMIPSKHHRDGARERGFA